MALCVYRAAFDKGIAENDVCLVESDTNLPLKRRLSSASLRSGKSEFEIVSFLTFDHSR